ncbi:MAG: hypothetical protein NVSMB30_11110 [Hymenobacter sp.]
MEGTRYAYAVPTLLPNICLGWRNQRLTVSLDGQLYHTLGTDGFDLLSIFYGENYALRFGVGYRLGSTADRK